MKHKHMGKTVSFRIPDKDYDKLLKAVGPYGVVSALIRAIIKQFLNKEEHKAA